MSKKPNLRPRAKYEAQLESPAQYGLMSEGVRNELIHVGSGSKVSHFETMGQKKSGRSVSVIFSGDKSGFNAMQLLTLDNEVRRMLLTHGEYVDITRGKYV